mmetsp:Transcript_24504/g.36511  ORF Transcript_24504/g.36511 Transcript_24504/m.36511 type:complete len:292 (+) Transcript_24504:233-1108(+)
MPLNAQRNNRLMAKRAVMAVLHEDEEVNDTNIILSPDNADCNDDVHCNNVFVLPDEISTEGPDSEENIRLLIDDIEAELQKRKDAIIVKADQAVAEQKQIAYLRSIKLSKSVRKMTIKEYNKMYGGDLLEMFQTFELKDDELNSSSGICPSGKKRIRPVGNGGIVSSSTMISGKMCLETPARSVPTGRNPNTPATVIRTVRKGEIAYSENGSPVDIVEQGDLVATVHKKRRGNDNNNMSAAFDIKVGDGRYINLSDPGSTDDLTKEMKDAARIQLKVLQDQMESLMAKLGN